MSLHLYETVAFEVFYCPGEGVFTQTQLETPPFEITILNSTRPLSKTIKLKSDGITLDKGQSHPLASGRYATRSLAACKSLPTW